MLNIKHDGDEEIISKIAGISHESEQGPGVEKLLVWNHLSLLNLHRLPLR